MSDTHAHPYTPARKDTGRTTSVWVWLLVFVVSLCLLGGVVWWVGGPTEALSMLGLNNVSLPSLGSLFGGGSSPSGGGAPSQEGASADTSATTTLPASAQERMFTEQAESRVALSDLVSGDIASLSLGKAAVHENTATVLLSAKYKDGSDVSGTMTLAKYEDIWYFFSLSRDKRKTARSVETPGSVDSGVVATIANEQAQAGTQDLIKKGILGGGFNEVKIDAVHPGRGTASIDVTLSGGTETPVEGRLVCVSKSDAGTTYWFVASFEKR